MIGVVVALLVGAIAGAALREYLDRRHIRRQRLDIERAHRRQQLRAMRGRK